ncbi:hypothetical protein [Spirochaeta africana]|uniref:Uncharacterized protein n=1 Tax=Spirochaeta africana (strain ATCC 700263 / DSM 8902 / Z-7692) TaxID=889378 RepID=H9ULB5_SPIAZ|nr:hypothetical protein [Spirochaeta africana]AFG38308.1 hypothetical protein Spiaf_2272 [Spirochaeta africana DSM 8902]
MKTISLEDLKATLKLFKDGFIFEEFAKAFLSAYYGEKFIPVGNVHDRGIDGLEHIIGRVTDKKNISSIY